MSDAVPAATPKRRKPYVPTGRKPGRPRGSVSRPKAVTDIPTIKPGALRVADAAKYLSISESMVRKLINDGRLPSVKIGTIRLIPTSGLDRLAEPGT